MMRRDSTAGGSFEEGDEIFDIASEFEDPVVRRYASMLRDGGVTLKSFTRPTITQELVRCGIPEIPAGDIVDAFRKYQKKGSVGVFWDLENIGLPPNIEPLVALTALRDVIMNKFGDIKEFKAYVDLAVFAQDFLPDTRVLFRDCGVEMVDAPHNRRKEVADKHIIVDALWFAVHCQDPIVCLISGDSDFSPLLSKLKMNGVPTIVISTSKHVRSLREQSTWALSWPESFLLDAEPPREQGQRNRSGFGVNPYSQAPSTTMPPPPYSQSPGANKSPTRQVNSPSRSGAPARSPRSGIVPTSEFPPEAPSTPTPSRSNAGFPADPAIVKSSGTLSPQQGTELKREELNSKSQEQKFMDSAYSDLIDCIRQVQKEVGMKKVRRSAVGLLFKRLNPIIPFKHLIGDAEAAGIVTLGGQLGHAWIALASDHADDDAPATGNAAEAQSGAIPASGDWWITLRFNKTFSSFGSLASFAPTDTSIKVVRLQEPSGGWHRMGLGPFRSLMDADNYYQVNFGEMQLLPKVTQNLKKYLDPSLFSSTSTNNGSNAKS